MPRYAYEKDGLIYTFGEDDEPPPQPVGTFESGLISWSVTEEDAAEDLAYLMNAIHDAETGDTVEVTLSAEDDFQRLGWRVV